MRIFIILIGLLATSAAMAQAAYRWVDENGVVQYSDRPQEGASEITIEVLRPSGSQEPTYKRRQAPEATPKEQLDAAAFTYTKIEFASPAAEETVWNIEGNLTVSLVLEPALRREDQLRVYLDGTPTVVSGTQFQIQNVYRGSHVLQAEVLDAQGKLKIRSKTSTFYVQQTHINPQPARLPNRG